MKLTGEISDKHKELALKKGIESKIFSSEDYGLSVKDICANSEISLLKFALYCFPRGTSDLVKRFGECILKGDGDCPYCGGETEMECDNWVHTEGNGIDSEKLYEPVDAKYKCLLCGEYK